MAETVWGVIDRLGKVSRPGTANLHESRSSISLSANMQFKILTISALATLAAATGTPAPASQCNTGNLQCCNSVQSSNTGLVSSLLGLLGVVLGSVDAQVGVTCSPISVIGVGGNSCTAQPVCCENNTFNGIVALGCSPVNLNL
ncbi:hypothetical protein D9758_010047 [Tetrapyrgos nigripes]|uniref:Hydrophobin n=1 Tax=Tetrapyrgos nigripes TaxID=182062 RepID=A0A8H5CVX2_9AGAR|nr:hypothetical protein D9758_010047 [Tetrapyrgos nigripes]